MTLRLNETLQDIQSTYSHPGRLEWIGVRPGKKQEMIEVETVLLITDQGSKAIITAREEVSVIGRLP